MEFVSNNVFLTGACMNPKCAYSIIPCTKQDFHDFICIVFHFRYFMGNTCAFFCGDKLVEDVKTPEPVHVIPVEKTLPNPATCIEPEPTRVIDKQSQMPPIHQQMKLDPSLGRSLSHRLLKRAYPLIGASESWRSYRTCGPKRIALLITIDYCTSFANQNYVALQYMKRIRKLLYDHAKFLPEQTYHMHDYRPSSHSLFASRHNILRQLNQLTLHYKHVEMVVVYFVGHCGNIYDPATGTVQSCIYSADLQPITSQMLYSALQLNKIPKTTMVTCLFDTSEVLHVPILPLQYHYPLDCGIVQQESVATNGGIVYSFQLRANYDPEESTITDVSTDSNVYKSSKSALGILTYLIEKFITSNANKPTIQEFVDFANQVAEGTSMCVSSSHIREINSIPLLFPFECNISRHPRYKT